MAIKVDEKKSKAQNAREKLKSANTVAKLRDLMTDMLDEMDLLRKRVYDLENKGK